MSVNCKSCEMELPEDEYRGAIDLDTLCPNCGALLRRNFTMFAGGGDFNYSGGDVSFTHHTYPEGLLEEVDDLIHRKKFTIAVVVSQMACEISVERALSLAFDNDKVQHLAETVTKMLSGRSITNGNVRKLYDALTGKDTLADLQTLKIWDGLRSLAEWRNAAVHRGKICTEDEAKRAMSVARELVNYFKP